MSKSEHICRVHDLTCKECDKLFQYPYLLKRHLKQKTKCSLILGDVDLSEEEQKKKYKCCFCGRRYTTYSSMRRHVRETCKIAPNKKNGEAGMELLYDYIIKKQQGQIEQQVGQIEQQQKTNQRVSCLRILVCLGAAGC